jgi:hypothetical protein
VPYKRTEESINIFMTEVNHAFIKAKESIILVYIFLYIWLNLRFVDLLGKQDFYSFLEKVHITSLNFCESPFFLCDSKTRQKHLPDPVISSFEGGFVFFFFYLFRLNL